MGTTNSRKLRREQDQVVMKRRQDFAVKMKNAPAQTQGPFTTAPSNATRPGATGWGVGSPGAKAAQGQNPVVNPWMMPKPTGLTHQSQTYAPNYFVEWNFSTWRSVVDQARNYGFTMPYATMVTWVYQCSPFVRSMFRTYEAWLDNVPFFCEDGKGNQYPEWTKALCGYRYQRKIFTQHLLARFWGFTGLNFDPYNRKLLKYPMQDIDPVNGMLRQSTWNFSDGLFFDTTPNILLIQPDTSQEGFLGDMEPIARSFIAMNLNKNSWLNAGLRLAMPIITAGYPQNESGYDAMGREFNQFKLDAEDILANIKPGEGVAYPYITNDKGERVPSIDIQFEKPGTGAKAHDIFVDFNEAEKNEIREMCLGGTLTADAGDRGSRALGEVQERKYEMFMRGPVEDTVEALNVPRGYLDKMRPYFENMPDDLVINIDRTRQRTIDEIVALGGILKQSGLRYSKKFFVSTGLTEEFFEDDPQAQNQKILDPDVKNPIAAAKISKKDLQSIGYDDFEDVEPDDFRLVTTREAARLGFGLKKK